MNSMLLLLLFYLFRGDGTISTDHTMILSSDKINHQCRQPLQRGNCSQKIPLFYYNNSNHKCQKFIFSGCGGNENRFWSYKECQSKCNKMKHFLIEQVASTSESSTRCKHKFDLTHYKTCHQSTPVWKSRYFYDSNENRCRHFWYDGCKISKNMRNFFINEESCKLTCVRKKRFKTLTNKWENMHLKGSNNGACFMEFDSNLRFGCKTHDWHLRFFYNRTTSKCEMFWYDISCPKPKTIINMFYHESACRRLCSEQAKNAVISGSQVQNSSHVRRIGHISAFFSQPYKSIRAFRNHQKLARMINNFGDFVTGTRIKPGKKLSEVKASEKNRTALIKIVPKQITQIKMKSQKQPEATVPGFARMPKVSILPELLPKLSTFKSSAGGHFDAWMVIQPGTSVSTTAASTLFRIRAFQTQVGGASGEENKDNEFDIQVTRAEFRRSLGNKLSREQHNINENYTTYELEMDECGVFDPKLADSCALTEWLPRYYYDVKSGQCRMFWSSGCNSKSRNNFETLARCQLQCELKQSDLRANSITQAVYSSPVIRCLEPLAVGNCTKMYPAYYYNENTFRCEPFLYSGCGGNLNRFLTLRQCQTTCNQLRGLSLLEANCLLPFDGGERTVQKKCLADAGIRYYYDQNYGRCERFWFSGCGGNENRFFDYKTCEMVCQTVSVNHVPEKIHPEVCFQPIKEGKCVKKSRKSIQRWAYNDSKLQCVMFNYSGCGGNQNRFATEHSCNAHCKSLIRPRQERCIAYPEWGECNQLRYRWFYNLTKGMCEQFLWGGCNDGNTNRFETFEDCQQTCEIPAKNICMQRLDRGQWCEPMSNRYYFNVATKTCKGFHYTGCGKSQNMFLTLSECEEKCLHNASSLFSAPAAANSSIIKYHNVKPPEKQAPMVHNILVANSKRYIKTDEQWLDDKQCIGYRYNISGKRTRLTSYLCLMEEGGACISKILSSTDGDEKCHLLKPWLRGVHLYSWFFTIDRHPYPFSNQALNETIAALIILSPNDCNSMC